MAMKYLRTVGFYLAILISITSNAQNIDWDKYAIAVEFQRNEQYIKAIKLYTEILNSDSNVFGCLVNRGQCFYELDEYDYSLNDLYKAVNIIQSDSMPFFMIGLNYMALEQYESSVEFFKYAMERGYVKSYPLLGNIGSCYLFLNKMDSAVVYLEKAFELNPIDNMLITNLAFAYLDKLPEKSCSYFNESFKLDSLSAQNINNLGYSHYLCGRADLAYEFYEKALKIDPENSFIYRNIGLYYKTLNDKEQACSYLNKALSMNFIVDWGEYYILELYNYCNQN
jgi:tetratricopeptide (TPR) repeat protein